MDDPAMFDLAAASAREIALAVVMAFATIVMLIPFVGVAFVVRQVIREMRMERRKRAATADAHDNADDTREAH